MYATTHDAIVTTMFEFLALYISLFKLETPKLSTLNAQSICRTNNLDSTRFHDHGLSSVPYKISWCFIHDAIERQIWIVISVGHSHVPWNSSYYNWPSCDSTLMIIMFFICCVDKSINNKKPSRWNIDVVI